MRTDYLYMNMNLSLFTKANVISKPYAVFLFLVQHERKNVMLFQTMTIILSTCVRTKTP